MIKVGSIVRCKYTNELGIVLRKVITHRGNFRYHVFIGGHTESFLLHYLEVINE